MDRDSSQTEETKLIVDDNEEKEQRCSSCFHFPKAVYFIIITEVCERFSYYGMRTILILYLTQHLLLKENNAVSIYHMFVSLCYFTTIIGSFISDNYLGKYKTLVVLCSLYTLGSTLMSLTAIPAINLSGPIISLLLIAFGTGGVKACVGPLGGDQIPSSKKVLLDSYFSMFYFGINLGALVSTILTPILRADVACNGSDDCYPLAFGIPAILMGVALAILLLGHKFYLQVPIIDSIYMKTISCFITAVKRWYRERHTTPKKELLEYASAEYDAAFINDLRTILRIAILYLPLPVYWALYEQMGSRWTLQAAQMDGEIGNITILPDQMSILNVIMVIVLIPIFDSCIYPISYKISPKLRPLRRMTIGISFTCLAFFAAFGLQKEIESRQPLPMDPGNARLILVNTHPCMVRLNVLGDRVLLANGYKVSPFSIDLAAGIQNIQLTYPNCKMINNEQSTPFSVNLTAKEVNFVVVKVDSSNTLSVEIFHAFRDPNPKGHPSIQIVASSTQLNNYNFQLKQANTGKVMDQWTVTLTNGMNFISNWKTYTNPGRFLWNVKSPATSNTPPSNSSNWIGVLVTNGDNLEVNPIKITSSEVVMFYMTLSNPEKSVITIPLILNNGSTISIMWQFPQYLLISIGEILVSITGLSFSYDQAPDGMKSLVNAFWYLSNAFGNVIVMIVAKLNLVQKQSWEYLIFALLCVVFNGIFAGLAFYYRMSKKIDYERMVEVTEHVE